MTVRIPSSLFISSKHKGSLATKQNFLSVNNNCVKSGKLARPFKFAYKGGAGQYTGPLLCVVQCLL